MSDHLGDESLQDQAMPEWAEQAEQRVLSARAFHVDGADSEKSLDPRLVESGICQFADNSLLVPSTDDSLAFDSENQTVIC